ncbi:hypothetical protein DL89DRAFT_86739 [Linderina pennispora]|uniref:Uncharacterized protein n=1 Tax=Linderina pennispora TaxID=61395 RepID=A0A1Y1WIA0_9FUNG|nr:uncharacterized protein DL89DRAFT_86739 [Linderina pennispora]ORX73048.1 hypothetical protein DL89DRAFT_86739 [Linderina pennispora]
MRFALALTALAALALAAPLTVRDDKSAEAVLPMVTGSKDYGTLESNINTFFANLGGSDDPDKSQRITDTAKKIQDQLQAYVKSKAPAQQAAIWAESVLAPLLT